MHIITVSGARSGAGKTTLAAVLAARLKGFAAVKVSISELYTTVTDDPAVIGQEGKDTAVLKEAGASPVVFVRCPRHELPEALAQALDMTGGARGVIIEGDSSARVVRPNTTFFVTTPDLGEVRPENMELLSGADVVVVNLEEDEVPPGLLEEIRGKNKAGVVTTMGRMRRGGGEVSEFFERLSG